MAGLWRRGGTLSDQTFPYAACLPYATESQDDRLRRLGEIGWELHDALAAEDWSRALYWNTELRDWMSLKFRMPSEDRIRLIKVYYEAITSLGIDSRAHARLMTTFLELTKRRYLTEELVLDWRRLWGVIKRIVIPSSEFIIRAVAAEDLHHLKTLAHAQQFFPASETDAMLEDFLPLFQTTSLDDAFLSVYLVCGFLPTHSYTHVDRIMSSIFHLWTLLSSSHIADAVFIEFLSRWSRDAYLSGEPYNAFLTDRQLDYLFTHFLRLMKIPVGNSSGSSNKSVDAYARNVFFNRKFSTAKDMARLLIYMLPDDRVLDRLVVFVDATENYFHPSNSGAWITPLASTLFELVTFFQLRLNRERSGEFGTRPGRSLEDLRDRFVRILRKITFMTTYNRNQDIQNLAQAALQGLSFVSPDLMIPGALKRIYPSLQGLVEAHRTAVSLHDLANLTPIIVTHPRWRAHLTTLVTFSLPGIDANDLNKTSITLIFLTQVAQTVAIDCLSDSTSMAQSWIEGELVRLEEMADDDAFDCSIADAREMTAIAQSSTAAWSDIVVMFLDRMFILLQNLPPTMSSMSGEQQAQNELICLLTPFFAALSDDLFELASRKIIEFVQTHTLYNVTDTMSGVINALCKANSQLTWKTFFEPLMTSIRSEVVDNGAGSTRSGGAEILPRDRGLVWYLRCFEGMIDAGGPALFRNQKEIRGLLDFLIDNCVSQATEFVGIIMSSFLEGMVETYPMDHRRLVDEEIGGATAGLDSWGRFTHPQKLKIRWHVTSADEAAAAADFFLREADKILAGVEKSIEASRERGGKVKQEWSDVIVSRLSYLENLLNGATEMYKSRRPRRSDEEVRLGDTDYSPVLPHGFIFEQREELRSQLEQMRDKIGRALHEWLTYLAEHHADDVLCFDVLLLVIKTWFGNVGYQRADGSQSKLTNIYVEDISQFKIPGRRKEYPRPYLVRRALLYHVQRTKHSAQTVDLSPTHQLLLNDLAETAVGAYTEIRAIAQSALNLAFRSVANIRASVIPFFLDALDSDDNERVKGALYTLSGKGLKSHLGRDMRYFPVFLRKLVLLSNVEKPSMMLPVKEAFLECALKSRPAPTVCVYDKRELSLLGPGNPAAVQQYVDWLTEAREYRESRQLELRSQLVELSERTDWRIAGAAASALGVGISSLSLPPSPEVATTTLRMATSDHPALRAISASQIAQVLAVCWLRVLTHGDIRDAALENLTVPGRSTIDVMQLNKEQASFFIDDKRSGWLAWPQAIEVFDRDAHLHQLELDPQTQGLFDAMGQVANKEWFLRVVDFWKEEPKEGSGRFRSHVQHILRMFFVCARRMPGSVALDDVKPVIESLCTKSSPHYHHRVAAELLSGLLGSMRYESEAVSQEIWTWSGPLLQSVLHDRLTPENLEYWQACISTTFRHRDPKRFAPLLSMLVELPLEIDSHASAFSEAAKLSVLRKAIHTIGWHFDHGDRVCQLGDNIDHPYKRVRDEIGKTLNNLFSSQYAESYPTVAAFVEANGPFELGAPPYQPTEVLSDLMKAKFAQLKQWRKERVPGTEQPTPYTMGSKTVLAWISASIDSSASHQLLRFVPLLILPELLHMLDVKEDHDLLVAAVGVFKQLSNLVYPVDGVKPVSRSLVSVMVEDRQWHHRLRVMAIIQVFYYRNVFHIQRDEREHILSSVVSLLDDAQLEVREGAASTLSGMIRASSYERDELIARLVKQFEAALDAAPLPPRRRYSQVAESTVTATVSKAVIKRHAPILGLCALVSAFPYDTPPAWLPAVLARLARCADNPHPIGASVKRVLASFKKTHNDTWHADQRAFTQEQLDDLAEPSHTYFA